MKFFENNKKMLPYLMAAFFVGSSFFTSRYLYLNYYLTLAEKIENVKNADDIVHILRSISGHGSSDEIADKLTVTIREHGLSDACVSRISQLAVQYTSDLGIKGFAVSTLWACILADHIELSKNK